MYSEEQTTTNFAVIKVIGVGGGGNNAINSMAESKITAAELISVNTDLQDLLRSKAEKKLQIGASFTKGLGAGSNPEIGEKAAEESKEELTELIKGTDLLFITAGMGGGTGTGAAPVIARIAKEMGILTVAVVTKPFGYEGLRREDNALKGIANLKKYVDTLVIIPNDKLLQVLPKSISFVDAFKVADDVLRQGISGIVDLIATPSLINLDFADVSSIMKNQGLAHMGIGTAKGDNRLIEAVRQAVSSPLLETTIEGAKGVILNVKGGKDLSLGEVNEAARLVQGVIDYSANIIFGTTIDENMADEIAVTVIATGFSSNPDSERNDPIAINPATQLKKSEESLKPYQAPYSDEPVKKVEVEVAQPEPEKESFSFPDVEEINAPVEEEEVIDEEIPEPRLEKKKELPAFMRKLFGKKD